MLADAGRHPRSHLRAEDPRKGDRGLLDDGDLEVELPGGGGDLRAHEARADHDEPGARAQIREEGLGVIEGAQVVHPTQIGEPRQPPGSRTGGDHEPAPSHGPPAEGRTAPMKVDIGRARVPCDLDLLIAPEPLPPLCQRRGGAGSQEQPLGERRALVGEMRLLAGDDDGPVVADGSERLGTAARASGGRTPDANPGSGHRELLGVLGRSLTCSGLPWIGAPYPLTSSAPHPRRKAPMSESPDQRPLFRSRRRDEHVRTVSRATRAIAALAVLGTATFGGLAAASTRASSSATTATTAAASAATGSSSSSQPYARAEASRRPRHPGPVGAAAGCLLRRLLT